MKITVYTIPDCPFCKQTKDYLTAKGLPFDEKDVLNNKDFLAEMLQKSQNFAGVPFTLIEDGATSIPLKGFTQSEFDEALSKANGSDTGMPASMPPVTPPQQPKPAADPAIGVPQPMTPKPLDTSATAPMNQPASTGMSSTPPLDGALNMSKPADTAMPKPTATFQPAPSTPNLNSNSQPLPASPVTDDPQKELNSLLEDLQTKVDVADPMPTAPAQPVVPAPQMPSAPSASIPSDSGTSTSGMSMPSAPIGQATPPAAPDLPDFSKAQ